jgi:hypothetical protein
MNCCRLKDDDYVSDEEDDESDEDDDYGSDDNVDMRKRLIVCFPCQYKFRVSVTNNEVIDVWEVNDSEVGCLIE